MGTRLDLFVDCLVERLSPDRSVLLLMQTYAGEVSIQEIALAEPAKRVRRFTTGSPSGRRDLMNCVQPQSRAPPNLAPVSLSEFSTAFYESLQAFVPGDDHPAVCGAPAAAGRGPGKPGAPTTISLTSNRGSPNSRRRLAAMSDAAPLPARVPGSLRRTPTTPRRDTAFCRRACRPLGGGDARSREMRRGRAPGRGPWLSCGSRWPVLFRS